MPERKRFLLRLDPEVFDAVERWAGDDLRSINAQIEYLLGDALRRAGRASRPRRVGTREQTVAPPESEDAETAE